QPPAEEGGVDNDFSALFARHHPAGTLTGNGELTAAGEPGTVLPISREGAESGGEGLPGPGRSLPVEVEGIEDLPVAAASAGEEFDASFSIGLPESSLAFAPGSAAPMESPSWLDGVMADRALAESGGANRLAVG